MFMTFIADKGANRLAETIELRHHSSQAGSGNCFDCNSCHGGLRGSNAAGGRYGNHWHVHDRKHLGFYIYANGFGDSLGKQFQFELRKCECRLGNSRAAQSDK